MCKKNTEIFTQNGTSIFQMITETEIFKTLIDFTTDNRTLLTLKLNTTHNRLLNKIIIKKMNH